MNTVYGHLDRRKRSPLTFLDEVSDRPDDAAPQPDHSVLHAELQREVAAALSELAPKLRAAIVLTSIQQLEIREAAHIEGCSKATMYWRIHQARKVLKRRLARYLS